MRCPKCGMKRVFDLAKCPSCGHEMDDKPDTSSPPASGNMATVVTNQSKTKRKCPFCAEEINIDAVKCKHCGEYQTEALREESKKYEKQTAASTKTIRMFITVIIAGIVISGLIKSCADIYFTTH